MTLAPRRRTEENTVANKEKDKMVNNNKDKPADNDEKEEIHYKQVRLDPAHGTLLFSSCSSLQVVALGDELLLCI